MYILKELPYEYDALEPFIDTHTLGLHKNKHEKNYLNKLNELLIKNNYDFRYSLEELAKHINNFDINNKEDILFNLGGVINHEIYFNSMNPNKVMPNEMLTKLLNGKYGNYENFKKEFKEKALSIKGSGYTFLVLNGNDIEIVNLLNQDNPYNHNYIPLIGLDMWEHAYYINYENKKDIYIDNYFEVVNFSIANRIF
ncbi:MAG: superoxide dismutase [Bacilli bacterium]|nr:superoxide dismutase [Bacilli bacterium]